MRLGGCLLNIFVYFYMSSSVKMHNFMQQKAVDRGDALRELAQKSIQFAGFVFLLYLVPTVIEYSAALFPTTTLSAGRKWRK